MKKLKSLTLLSAIAATTLFTGCDGGSSTDNQDAIERLSRGVNRGLDVTEILENPFSTPGFPYSLSEGETITFIPTNVPSNSFITQVPLGTWEAESSGLLRQGAISPSLYFPATEESFRYLYATTEPSADPEPVSTQSSAAIEYTFEHRFEREADFLPRMSQVLSTSSEPGSLFHAITTSGLVTSRNRTIIDAISALGMAAVDHPSSVFTTEGGLTSVTVRKRRNITLYDINSTNAQLDPSGDLIITGQYFLRDTWQQVTLSTESPLIDLNNNNGTDVEVTEDSTGTFIMRLNQLTRTP